MMHCKLWYLNYLALLTDPKQPLVFEKCALSDLMFSHVIDSEVCEGHMSSTISVDIALFPGLPHLQLLIASSMQKRRRSKAGGVEGLGTRLALIYVRTRS